MEAKHLLIVLVISIVLCLVNLILSGLSLAKAGSSKSNYRNIEQNIVDLVLLLIEILDVVEDR